FSSRRRHTRLQGDWSSDVCSSDLTHRAPSARLFLAVGSTLGAPVPLTSFISKASSTIIPARIQGGEMSLGQRLQEIRQGFERPRSEERRVGKEGTTRWASVPV